MDESETDSVVEASFSGDRDKLFIPASGTVVENGRVVVAAVRVGVGMARNGHI